MVLQTLQWSLSTAEGNDPLLAVAPMLPLLLLWLPPPLRTAPTMPPLSEPA